MDKEETESSSPEVQFENLSAGLGLPNDVKIKAWNNWLELSSKADLCSLGNSTIDWLVVAIYFSVTDSCFPAGLQNSHLDHQPDPYVTLTELLQKANSNVIRFMEKMRKFREEVCLSEAVTHQVNQVERKYCIISPLFHRFEREWSIIFREEDGSPVSLTHTESTGYKRELCWLLFLHAKECLESRELIHTYHLLLNCLEYVLRSTPSFQLRPPFDTLRLQLADNIDQNGYNVAILAALADHFHTNYEELVVMQTQAKPIFECLKTQDGEIDLPWLKNMYESEYRRSGGLDERLFLSHDPHLLVVAQQNKSQPSTSSYSGIEPPVTPVRAALNTIQQLRNMLSTEGDEPCAELKLYFQNCASSPESSISNRLKELQSRFCEKYSEKMSASQSTVAVQRFKQATSLYFRVMKTLLDMEKERLSHGDFSTLLNNDTFHRSLLACSAEIVLVTYNISWNPTSCSLDSEDNTFAFPWILEVFNLYAYDFYKVLESFIKAEPNLTREIVKHLTHIENKILDSIAWKSGSPLYDAIAKSEGINSNFTSPSKDLHNGHSSQSTAAELLDGMTSLSLQDQDYLSPVRGQRTRGVPQGNVVITPTKTVTVTNIYSRESPKSTSAPHRSNSLNMFFNKVCRLGYHRMTMVCDMLKVPKDTQHKIWTCFEYCVTYRSDLMKDRHLDQILMCSLYGICKVCDSEIKFKDIVRVYSNLPHAEPQTYKEALIEGNQRDSIISFYNRVFMQNMKNFILQFAPKQLQPNLSPVPRPVSSPLNASPVYRIPGRQNFYVSPMKVSPFKSPHSPGSMTPRSRQLYSFGELLGSSEKLKSINETVSAFRPRGNLPYVTTPHRGAGKRLSFDKIDDNQQNSPGSVEDSSPEPVIKKQKVNPPPPFQIYSSAQNDSNTSDSLQSPDPET